MGKTNRTRKARISLRIGTWGCLESTLSRKTKKSTPKLPGIGTKPLENCQHKILFINHLSIIFFLGTLNRLPNYIKGGK